MKKFLSILSIVLLISGLSFAQGKMGVSVQGGIALPMGDFGDGYDMGFGGTGTFVYNLNPNFSITATAGYLTWSGKVADFTFSSIPVLAGVRYAFGKGKFNPYVAGQLGMHFVTVKSPSIVVLGIDIGGSASDSNFGFAAGAGFLYALSNNLNLDVNAMFNSITASGGSSNYVTALVGLLFGFN